MVRTWMSPMASPGLDMGFENSAIDMEEASLLECCREGCGRVCMWGCCVAAFKVLQGRKGGRVRLLCLRSWPRGGQLAGVLHGGNRQEGVHVGLLRTRP